MNNPIVRGKCEVLVVASAKQKHDGNVWDCLINEMLETRLRTKCIFKFVLLCLVFHDPHKIFNSFFHVLNTLVCVIIISIKHVGFFLRIDFNLGKCLREIWEILSCF